jgi:secreted Zn-dependent insulinase-like peptidase
MRSATAGAVALVALGCATPVLERQPEPSAADRRWAEERERFTRSRKMYDLFDEQAFATATWQASPVREARALQLATWKEMTPAERDKLLAAERAEGESHEDFFLAFYTSDRRANDLLSQRSVWRIALAVPGEGEMLPEKVEAVTIDPTLEALYPYLGKFDLAYRIRFPRWKGDKPLAELPFELVIAGALGKIELTWNE